MSNQITFSVADFLTVLFGFCVATSILTFHINKILQRRATRKANERLQAIGEYQGILK